MVAACVVLMLAASVSVLDTDDGFAYLDRSEHGGLPRRRDRGRGDHPQPGTDLRRHRTPRRGCRSRPTRRSRTCRRQRAQPDRPRDARRRGALDERHRGAGGRRAGDRARQPGQGRRRVRHGSRRSDASRSPNCGACSACCATPATTARRCRRSRESPTSRPRSRSRRRAGWRPSWWSRVTQRALAPGDRAGRLPRRAGGAHERAQARRPVGVRRRCASPTRPTSSTVEVTDDGRGAATSLSGRGAGHGLIGMRERVEIYGGEFTSGPRARRGLRRARRAADRAQRRHRCSADRATGGGREEAGTR